MQAPALLRQAIVAEALSWLGTPYHHHGRIKGVGVDCAQILLAIYSDTFQIAPALDVGYYSTQWHLHRNEELYLEWLQRAGARRVDAPEPGDITMYRVGRTFSHSGIWTGEQWVHAWHDAGVILTRPDEEPLCGRTSQHWAVVPEQA